MATAERKVYRVNVFYPGGQLGPQFCWPAGNAPLPSPNVHVMTDDDRKTIPYGATHVLSAHGWSLRQAAFAAGWWYEQVLAEGALEKPVEQFGYELGEVCGRKGCEGVLHVDRNTKQHGGCSCRFGSPPCPYCTSSFVTCPECGWDEREEPGYVAP